MLVHVPEGAEDDTRLAVRSLRKRARTATWIGIVAERSDASFDDVSWVAPSAFACAEVVDAVLTGSQGSPGVSHGAAPLSPAELDALLARCRAESYFAILDVRRDAEPETVTHFAEQWLARLAATRSTAADAAVLERVAEAAEAVRDARDVLCSERARAFVGG